MAKRVYKFSEGNANMRELLGGKGAGLAEMTNLGIPVPDGFTISTEACTDYYNEGKTINKETEQQIFEALKWLEGVRGKKFGDLNDPLLVSVRSGARASMPGMMDTILNLGLNDESVVGFAKKTGNPRFAYDSYRRFIQMFSDVVMGMSKTYFDSILEGKKKAKGYKFDTELTAEDLQEIIKQFKDVYKDKMGEGFPQDPRAQLIEAIKAVFRSWDNPRANSYRRMYDIPYEWGTAVNVQSMVFGNMGNDCGTGVCFSRDPSTGAHEYFYGEYLINAQGEDVVAGIRTPQQISKQGSMEWAVARGISEEERQKDYPSLEESMPEAFKALTDVKNKLEAHYRDMQDMEFTIESGKLFMLQTRNGKRTAFSALQIACDLVDEKVITPEEAVCRIEPQSLDQLLHPNFDQNSLLHTPFIGQGLPASPGAAAGRVFFTAEEAEAAHSRGDRVILVRQETSPEDIEGMHAAEGILTMRGGMTSHAAVVARGMGTCCVSGCGDMKFDEAGRKFSLGGVDVHQGDYISLDGSTGKIYLGDIPTVDATITGNFERIMNWADKFRRLKIRTNADTPDNASDAVRLGAEGIGLCRTEHMFFEAERIEKMRKMILSDTTEAREKALSELIPYQKGDFKAIYRVMHGMPVTIRFLDPPLHEFLPKTDDEISKLANDMGLSFTEVKKRCDDLQEFNPMMGHRGCRLSITFPEIAKMQTRAVIEAAIEVKAENGFDIVPEIMVPLVGDRKELAAVRKVICEVAEKVKKERNSDIQYHVGTMIEIPRAALMADQIAGEAEFFSFGTNDLTQMTFGFSRDDSGKFLADYYKSKIYEADPFAHLDQNGVGQLIQIAAEKARKVRKDIHLGVCGEHGGDPASIEFFNRVGLDYVSCSPFRVPIARLAAAQAAINNK
ncbi:MAG: pyruvate, phosphate dikinase [Lachnospiraceae bacterium]|nr:pyruvate, phosphate dikinase [Lachnospiraceae bacterium]